MCRTATALTHTARAYTNTLPPSPHHVPPLQSQYCSALLGTGTFSPAVSAAVCGVYAVACPVVLDALTDKLPPPVDLAKVRSEGRYWEARGGRTGEKAGGKQLN